MQLRSVRFVRHGVALALVGVLLGACGDKEVATTSSTRPGGSGFNPNPIAGMFLERRSMLTQPGEALRGAVGVGLGGFTTPIGGASQSVSLDLTVSNRSSDRSLAFLSVIPYQVGNVETGPGARFVQTSTSSFLLKPGESRTVTVDAVRERVGGGAAAPGAPPGAPPVRSGVGRPALRSSWGSFVTSAQGSDVTPFDPNSGLQVLLVLQFADEVPPGSWETVGVVSEGEFSARYGQYAGYQYAIGVPVERLA